MRAQRRRFLAQGALRMGAPVQFVQTLLQVSNTACGAIVVDLQTFHFALAFAPTLERFIADALGESCLVAQQLGFAFEFLSAKCRFLGELDPLLQHACSRCGLLLLDLARRKLVPASLCSNQIRLELPRLGASSAL
jgi:hypothetical protein